MTNEVRADEMVNDVMEVVEVPEAGNGIAKVAIVVGALAVAGVGVLLYKRHKNKKAKAAEGICDCEFDEVSDEEDQDFEE